MEPATATLIAGALTATVAAGASAASVGVSQQESGFIVGATVINKSSVDFELQYYDEIRGSWGKAPGTKLLGTRTILKNILDANPIGPNKEESEIEIFVKKKIVGDAFSESSCYFSGINHGIGFQGCLRLYNEEKNLSIILYIGRPRNLGFRAAAWMGPSNSNEVRTYDANRWENWMNDYRKSVLEKENPSFSLGATKITIYNGFEIKYTSAERVTFEIKDNWNLDFLAAFKSYNNELIQAAGDTAVYLVVDGTRRWVPNPDTLLGLGYSWSDVNKVSKETLEGFPAGPQIPTLTEGITYKGNGPAIYLIRNKKRCWVTSPGVFNRLGLKWEDVKVISEDDLYRIPKGEDIR